MLLNKKNFKNIVNKLKKNQLTVGSWVQLNDPNSSLILSKGKFEWIVVDLEHGLISESNLPNIFRSIAINNTVPFSRIKDHKKSSISKVLDAGAYGIIVPNVENEMQLKKIIQYASYPPKGIRGVGFSASNIFGNNFNDYFNNFKKPIIIAMIESKIALQNLPDILNCDGLNGILLGPYDLSASLGVTGNFRNKKFTQTIQKVIFMCKKKGISVGLHQVQPSYLEFKKLIKKGFNFIPYGMDTVFLSNNYPKKKTK